jgi:AcrR family transcriptional regulator
MGGVTDRARTRRRGRPAGPGVDAARRREELLDAAERAIEAMGTSVSLAEIARAAGYARSAVYAAFSGKAEVLAALSERHAGNILLEMFGRATAEHEPKDQFRAILDVLFAWAQERPRLYWALIRPLNEGDAGPGLFDLLAGAIEAMLGPAQAAAGGDAELAAPGARAMMGSAIAAIEWWLRGGTVMPRDRLVGYLTDLAWHGGAGLPDGWMGLAP